MHIENQHFLSQTGREESNNQILPAQFPLHSNKTRKLINSKSILTKQQQQQHTYIMSLEATLTRELNIRFIDARAFATEAKIQLGVEGYPTKAQEEALIAEAMYIFYVRPKEVRDSLVVLKSDLDAVKLSIGSLSSAASTVEMDDASSYTDSSTFTSSTSSSKKGSFRLFRRR
jgi:hypothetical protein